MMVTVVPAVFELRVSWVNPTVFTVPAQVMWVIALTIPMAPMFAVTAIPDAVTCSYFMTFFTTPVTVSFDRPGAALLNRLLGVSDLSVAKGGVGGSEVMEDATIEVSVGIGVSKASRTVVK